jgi:hypothetical protein
MTSAVFDACDHERLKEVQMAKLVITMGQEKDNSSTSYSDEYSPAAHKVARPPTVTMILEWNQCLTEVLDDGDEILCLFGHHIMG